MQFAVDDQGARLAYRAYGESVQLLGNLSKGLEKLGLPTQYTGDFGFVLRIPFTASNVFVVGVAVGDMYTELQLCQRDSDCSFENATCILNVMCVASGSSPRGMPCTEDIQWSVCMHAIYHSLIGLLFPAPLRLPCCCCMLPCCYITI